MDTLLDIINIPLTKPAWIWTLVIWISISFGFVLGAAWAGLCKINNNIDDNIKKNQEGHFEKRINEIQKSGRISEKGKGKDRR